MNKKFFIVRVKGTERCLHQLKKGAQTHVEPSDVHEPRLFNTRNAASCALTWWLKGECFMSFGEPDGIIGFSSPEPIGLDWRTKPERRAEDMEIVPVLLQEIRQ